VLAGSGGALLQGSPLSGLDAIPAAPGVYTVQVIDSTGGLAERVRGAWGC
jgi:hypothetical protein